MTEIQTDEQLKDLIEMYRLGYIDGFLLLKSHHKTKNKNAQRELWKELRPYALRSFDRRLKSIKTKEVTKT